MRRRCVPNQASDLHHQLPEAPPPPKPPPPPLKPPPPPPKPPPIPPPKPPPRPPNGPPKRPPPELQPPPDAPSSSASRPETTAAPIAMPSSWVSRNTPAPTAVPLNSAPPVRPNIERRMLEPNSRPKSTNGRKFQLRALRCCQVRSGGGSC